MCFLFQMSVRSQTSTKIRKFKVAADRVYLSKKGVIEGRRFLLSIEKSAIRQDFSSITSHSYSALMHLSMLSFTPSLYIYPTLFYLGQPNALRARAQSIETLASTNLSSPNTIPDSSPSIALPANLNISLDLTNVSNSALGGNATQVGVPGAQCDFNGHIPNANSCKEAYGLLAAASVKAIRRQKLTVGPRGGV